MIFFMVCQNSFSWVIFLHRLQKIFSPQNLVCEHRMSRYTPAIFSNLFDIWKYIYYMSQNIMS
jgi:hypothetical protein